MQIREIIIPTSEKREIALLLVFKGKKLMAIFMDGCVYQIHPLYDLYSACIDGKIIHIIRQVPNAGYKQHNGYLQCKVRKYGEKNQKGYRIHRFVWECYNRLILDDKVIDHVNDNKDNNRLRNLQIMTQQENCKSPPKNVTIHLRIIIIKTEGIQK